MVPLVEVENLRVHYKRRQSLVGKVLQGQETVYAVDGVSLDIMEGQTFGLVGESGCGKTTTGKAVLRLAPKTDGRILFKGQEVFDLDSRGMRGFRKSAQMIFQDPISSLNPRMCAGDIIAEPLEIHGDLKGRQEIESRVETLLEEVGLLRDDKKKYPHEFSGGQAQRIGVARALAVHPEFLVCDEPTSGMDVSIMSKIINFMLDIKEKHNLTYLWISHNLEVVQYICDRLAIMYLGRIVEHGSVEEIFDEPLHPYTQALLSAAPSILCKIPDNVVLRGEVPSAINRPPGCAFAPRCWMKEERCTMDSPKLRKRKNGRSVACFLVD